MEKMEELKEMRKKIHRTLTGPALPIDAVLDAVDVLVREMQSGVYSDLLGDYDLSNSPERLSITAKQMGRRPLGQIPVHVPIGCATAVTAEGSDLTPMYLIQRRTTLPAAALIHCDTGS